MEQEVFVPVPAERLRAALADPAQVARAVPGLQQDAGTPPIAGRLKVRVGSHTITYRGTAQVAPAPGGTYTVRADAAEARGTGKVHLALTLALTETPTGTNLRFTGTARADGRVTELPQETVAAAVARLLNRFGGNLGITGTGSQERHPGDPEQHPGASEQPPGQEPRPEPKQTPAPEPAPERASEHPLPPTIFETDIPPSSLEPLDALDPLDPATPSEPPAEAAHARRTMIGRSAEEVDHAPPRGRYAPVPAPQALTPANTLRWAAPAAALAVVSAVVVGRALRRRR
ncbi:SRPBCC family protein [Streptomyces roseirectus]|uniref:SRPBCC family protein n=1 Tax=Streptomyces roseirectus TaxID=2768066 RepID=A0A7H0IEM6_9ACTN|nr:SRPBCC family protein [Streptomyces roseirectus]QNP71242.1 SRPBCC family protein [Streptomyces roseirectus]